MCCAGPNKAGLPPAGPSGALGAIPFDMPRESKGKRLAMRFVNKIASKER